MLPELLVPEMLGINVLVESIIAIDGFIKYYKKDMSSENTSQI